MLARVLGWTVDGLLVQLDDAPRPMPRVTANGLRCERVQVLRRDGRTTVIALDGAELRAIYSPTGEHAGRLVVGARCEMAMPSDARALTVPGRSQLEVIHLGKPITIVTGFGRTFAGNELRVPLDADPALIACADGITLAEVAAPGRAA